MVLECKLKFSFINAKMLVMCETTENRDLQVFMAPCASISKQRKEVFLTKINHQEKILYIYHFRFFTMNCLNGIEWFIYLTYTYFMTALYVIFEMGMKEEFHEVVPPTQMCYISGRLPLLGNDTVNRFLLHKRSEPLLGNA
jgi:hypothetical protein